MSSSQPRIQEPVTGHESIRDPAQPLHALAEFYRALNARDLIAMQRHWDDSPAASMDNPLGGIRRGWSEVRTTYAALFESEFSYSFEFWDYTLHVSGEVFWAVGRERGRLAREGQSLELAIRTSRLFRRTDGRWRQIHHHGSIEDPVMLANYLEAVRCGRMPSPRPDLARKAP